MAAPPCSIEQPPTWFLERVDWSQYKAWLAMSTVSVDVDFHNYAPNIIQHMLIAVRHIPYDAGTIMDVSSPTVSTLEKDKETQAASLGSSSGAPTIAPKRGRAPTNERLPPKHPHGNYRSFGWSIECRLHIKLQRAFKDIGSPIREYKVKIFSSKIQVPGCCTEDYSDVRAIIVFLLGVLRQGYAGVPRSPLGFSDLQNRLQDRYALPQLKYAASTDLDGVRPGRLDTYSRNYTVHGPLVRDNEQTDEQSIHLRNLYEHLLHETEELHQARMDRSRLEGGVAVEWSPISETTSKRIQFIFHTPQHIDENTHNHRHHVTKTFLESSGKINIELSNNYLWADVLWRIISYLSEMFDADFYRRRMITKTNASSKPAIAKFYERHISDQELHDFIASLVSSGDEAVGGSDSETSDLG